MSAEVVNEKLVETISAAILAAVNPPASGYDAPADETASPASSETLDVASLAGMIDHTLLKPDATRAQIKNLCAEARQYGFASVCVNPTWVTVCAHELAGSSVKVCTVIGFPLGATPTDVKVFEAEKAIAQGATEVDMVINIGALKDGNLDLVEADIQAVAAAAHRQAALTKVIIETVFLTDDEKISACQLAKKSGADFVKTSTGFLGGGANAHDIALMRQTVGPNLGVKASGGVRTYEDAVAMVKAGATRIGASAGIKIIQGPSAKPPAPQPVTPKLNAAQVKEAVRQVLQKLA